MRRTEALAIWGLAALLFAATDPLIPLLARGAADMATTAELAAAASARRPVWAAIYFVCALLLWRCVVDDDGWRLWPVRGSPGGLLVIFPSRRSGRRLHILRPLARALGQALHRCHGSLPGHTRNQGDAP